VEIMIVVAIIGLLAAIAIPNFVKAARKQPSKQAVLTTCVRWDGAVQNNDVGETQKQDSEGYTLDDLKPYIRLDSNGDLPHCLLAETYSPGASVTNGPHLQRSDA